jgi:hypothetical protein
MPKDNKSIKPNFLSRLHGVHKLLISLIIAGIVYFLIPSGTFPYYHEFLLGGIYLVPYFFALPG